MLLWVLFIYLFWDLRTAHKLFLLYFFLFQVVRETWGLRGKRVQDYTVYTGALGTAYLAFKAYQVTKNANDLKLCSEIVMACDYASRESR